MTKPFLIFLMLLLGITGCRVSNKHHSSVHQNDSLAFANWHNRDLIIDKIPGASVELAFNKLLKDKKPSRIIVAVIDGGIDINHIGLKNKIWKNDDVPNNGIDDDANGFIDDTCGWNFLGNSNGQLIEFETLEITRLYKKYHAQYDSIVSFDSLSMDEKLEYLNYKKISQTFNYKYNEAKYSYERWREIHAIYKQNDSVIRSQVGLEKYTNNDLKNVKIGNNKILKKAVRFMLYVNKSGLTESNIIEIENHFEEQYKYQYNVDFNVRLEVIGDNTETNEMLIYGNNNVNHNTSHATFIAGVIVGIHNYSKTIYGISDSLLIMPVIAVPSGDERDKDIANAIHYAVDNGARIINMSFGKDYSPQKFMVDEAIKYAESKNVLIIHSAGNESENTDEITTYPSPITLTQDTIKSYLTIGASSIEMNKNLVADFSNYGKTTVDLFAPGVDLYSFKPNNKYGTGSGTSFSGPVVTGIASLIMSYYPSLSAKDVTEILLKSTLQINKPKVIKPGTKKKVAFSVLSKTGGIVNAYRAMQLAGEYAGKK